MSTDVATRSSKAAEDAARKRKRRAVIGASVGASVGLGLFAWWWSKRGDAADGDATTQPELDPIDDTTSGSRDPETKPEPTGI